MSSRQGSGDSEKRQFWQLAVETWRGSGLSARRFCEVEGLSKAAFYFWRRQLSRTAAAKEDGQADTRPSVCGRNKRPATLVQPKQTHASFIAVSIPRSGGTPLELVLTSGNVLRIGAAADSESLSRIVSVLHEAGLC